MNICDTDMHIKTNNSDMQYKYAKHICNTDMQYRHVIKICNNVVRSSMQQIHNKDMQYIYARMARPFYPTAIHTTKLKYAVGALCWDKFTEGILKGMHTVFNHCYEFFAPPSLDPRPG